MSVIDFPDEGRDKLAKRGFALAAADRKPPVPNQPARLEPAMLNPIGAHSGPHNATQASTGCTSDVVMHQMAGDERRWVFRPGTLSGDEIAKAVASGEYVADKRLLEWWDFYAGLAGQPGLEREPKLQERFTDVRDLLLELIGRRAKERL